MLKQLERASETAKTREGTRCRICGERITRDDWTCCNVVYTDGGCLGAVIYGHAHCCVKREYSYEHLTRNKKATYSGVQFGVELETNQRTTLEQRLYLYACYGLVCTADCTVEEEFKSGINQGLHGLKAYFEGIEKVVDIASGENCGSHVNISLKKWDKIRWLDELLNLYGSLLFLPLARAIRALTPQKRIEIFGRDFGEYREYSERHFMHGDWLQIKPFGLEFRISRYRNSTQYSHLIMMYAEMAKALDKMFLGVFAEHPRADRAGRQTQAAEAGKELVKILNRHAAGKASYQRPERNK